jgi:hypothetical protein
MGSSLAAGVARGQAQAGSFTVVVTIANSDVNLEPSTVPAGNVVFKILNRGSSARDFEIAGKKTPIIGSRKSATLRVVVAKRPYRYVSVGPGQAPLTGLVGVLKACTNPTKSTVDVQISSGMITLSQATVPCGTVTFVVTNTEGPGTHADHNFQVFVPTSVKGGLSAPLHPGETAKVTIDIPFKGKVNYVDGVGRNAELGGEGWLVVK